jgi:hypothetical protein
MLTLGLVLLPFSSTLAVKLIAIGVLSAGSGDVESTTSALLPLTRSR